MNTRRYTLMLGLCTLIFSACTSSPKELHAPCPDFGKGCKKIPVNVGVIEPVEHLTYKEQTQ